MSKQINVPDIGSDEVTVTEVMVNVGDTISADQSIINVEGDKASMEVPAPEAGVVKEVLVKVGYRRMIWEDQPKRVIASYLK